MTDNLPTLPQLLDASKEEESGIAYLEQQRWDGNPACSFCGALNPVQDI